MIDGYAADMIRPEHIRIFMDATGWKQKRLAEAVGTTQTTVHRWLKGAQPGPEFQAALAAVLRAEGTIDDSQKVTSVRIVGLAGAGPEGSVLYAEPEQDLGRAPIPPGWTPATVALEVRGNSMRPIAFDGWYVYYGDRESIVTDEMIGEPCVLWLASGHTVVKFPQHSREIGCFDLESLNPAIDTMRAERVTEAALVTAIIPKASARKLKERSGGDVGV